MRKPVIASSAHRPVAAPPPFDPVRRSRVDPLLSLRRRAALEPRARRLQARLKACKVGTKIATASRPIARSRAPARIRSWLRIPLTRSIARKFPTGSPSPCIAQQRRRAGLAGQRATNRGFRLASAGRRICSKPSISVRPQRLWSVHRANGRLTSSARPHYVPALDQAVRMRGTASCPLYYCFSLSGRRLTRRAITVLRRDQPPLLLSQPAPARSEQGRFAAHCVRPASRMCRSPARATEVRRAALAAAVRPVRQPIRVRGCKGRTLACVAKARYRGPDSPSSRGNFLERLEMDSADAPRMCTARHHLPIMATLSNGSLTTCLPRCLDEQPPH